MVWGVISLGVIFEGTEMGVRSPGRVWPELKGEECGPSPFEEDMELNIGLLFRVL